MKYKDLIKKLGPHADEEVIIFANFFEGYDEVAFYSTEDGDPFCVISQVDGNKAKFQKVDI